VRAGRVAAEAIRPRPGAPLARLSENGGVTPRRIGFLVFPRLTLLDFVGPYDALRRVRTMGVDERLEWSVLGSTDPVADDCGLRIAVDSVRPPLASFDLLVVAGGYGTDELARDGSFLEWLRTWPHGEPGRTLASVCTGSLLLGHAGFLSGRRATTHHARLEALAPLCAEVVRDQRVVDDGDVVTAGGVTSGIDLGLHLVGRFWGGAARARIAAQMAVPGSALAQA
jgi:cyclohexyl-isocyanide hydratase